MKSLLPIVSAFVVIFLSLSAVSGKDKAYMARVNDWTIIADKHHKCTDKLKNLSAHDTLETFLKKHNCFLSYLQCTRAFTNPYVDTAGFGLQSLNEQDDTFMLEVRCFKENGDPLFPPGNFSFIGFVADTTQGEVTEEQKDTFRFFKDLAAADKFDEYFGEYYRMHTGASQLLVWIPLVALPVMFQKMLF